MINLAIQIYVVNRFRNIAIRVFQLIALIKYIRISEKQEVTDLTVGATNVINVDVAALLIHNKFNCS